MPQCDPEVVLSIAQLCVRLLLMTFVSIGAILCIHWGWRLYRDCVVSRTSGELQAQHMTLKFTAAGPGVLLVAFGAWLLSLVAMHPMAVESETVRPTQPTVYERPAADYRFWKTSQAACPAASAPPHSADCDKCAIRRIKYSNMDGKTWEPTSQDIQAALAASKTALQALMASQPAGSTADAVRTLRTLSYLQAMAELDARQGSTAPEK